MDRWLGHVRTVLEAVAANPAMPIGAIPLLSASEKRALMRGMNETAAPLPTGPVHRLIEQQAARTPDAVAARFGDVTLTYAGLDAQANRMARLLLTYASPGDRVAVMLDRTPEMLTVLLGAWKAGMAYVPLDPSHPPARLGHIMADAGAAVLVTDGTGPELSGPVLDLRTAQDELLAQAADATRCREHGRLRDLHLGLDWAAEGRGNRAQGAGQPAAVDGPRAGDCRR